MSVELDRLEASVKANTEVKPSVIATLASLSAIIRAGAGDRAKMLALADELDLDKADLAQAVVDNTPAATP